jgi:3-phosphoshikimate 1-carboxyvinyltransferase
MAATQAADEVVLKVKALVSAPYLQLTREILRSFGAITLEDAEASVYRIQPCSLEKRRYEVEGDFSSAAYPAAGAILTGGIVSVEGLRQDSQQGDRGFLDVLSAMGAEVKWHDKGFEIRAERPLAGIDIDMSSLPDQVPTLAVLAPFAAGKTVIRNVRHLRIKESDRLAAMVRELGRLGAAIQERTDGLEIEGSWADRSQVPTNKVEVETHGDHRVAMSMAICGLARPGVVIGTPEVVAKSYPSFWSDLEDLIR